MSNTLENASSFDPAVQPSYAEVYGNILEGEAFKLLTEGTMLPEGFRDLEVWRAYADALDSVLGSTVGSLVRDLLGLNDITYLANASTISKPVLLQKARQLGITTDLNMFDTQDVRSFLQNTPGFWKEKGNRNFIEYMSFVVNAFIDMKYLWTEDYEQFYSEGAVEIGTPVYAGGTWYPTSHVYIVYDVNKFRSSVNANFTSQEALSKFFYSIAPIQLVIKSFLLNITSDSEPLVFAGCMQMRVWNNPKLNMNQATDVRFSREKMIGAIELLNEDKSPFGLDDTSFGTVLLTETSETTSYYEIRLNSLPETEGYLRIGIVANDVLATIGDATTSWAVLMPSGNKRTNSTSSACLPTCSINDTIQIAHNVLTGSIWFGRNNVWVGNPSAGTGAAFTAISGTNFRLAVSIRDGVTNRGVATFHSLTTDHKYTPPIGFTRPT